MGGGACGDSVLSSCVLLGAAEGGAVDSVSVSEPEDSRSQLSATGLDFGLCSGFCGTVVLSLRWESVAAISVSLGVLCMVVMAEELGKMQ